MTYKISIWPNFLLRRQILEKAGQKIELWKNLLKLYIGAKSVLTKMGQNSAQLSLCIFKNARSKFQKTWLIPSLIP